VRDSNENPLKSISLEEIAEESPTRKLRGTNNFEGHAQNEIKYFNVIDYYNPWFQIKF
jgi:hypothetical protein